MTQSRSVTVVTDSTSDLPTHVAEQYDIRVVPLIVRFGVEIFRDGIDLKPAEFLSRLTSSTVLPSTSQPSISAFEEVFRTELDAGRDVACVTISGALSGTLNAARLAAESVDTERIRVIDSGTSAMHLGLIAIEGSAAAQAGLPLAGVESAITSARRRSALYAVLETLDYLQRGGRIGRASHLVGSVLSIKPILTIRDGQVTPLERVRTWRKALDRLAELALQHAPIEKAAVMHAGNLTDAQSVARRLGTVMPLDEIMIVEGGPVLCTYAGPGAIGVFVLTPAT